MEQYKNTDGTYTSPKNGKTYKSLKAFTSHWYYAGTTDPASFSKRLYDVKCQHCNIDVIINNKKKHETSCYLNAINLTLCKVCSNPIKDYQHSKGTCSRSCANKHFKSGEGNGNWKGERYQSICFLHHNKKCVVCEESKIVAVHHYDHNHENNDPANLVPLCPTHHNYVHSRYAVEVQPIIDEYIRQFILRFA